MAGVEPRSASRPSGRAVGLGGSHATASPSVCVMGVPGTGIQVRDIDGGVAVSFDTLAPERVVELRSAVGGLVAAYEHGRRVARRHSHSARGVELARRYRALAGELPPLRAALVEVEGGAALEVKASDPAAVAALRAAMRAEVALMQRGVCPLVALDE